MVNNGLQLDQRILAALSNQGYVPSKLELKVIPSMSRGNNVVCKTQLDMSDSFAYIISLINRVIGNQIRNAIVIVPDSNIDLYLNDLSRSVARDLGVSIGKVGSDSKIVFATPEEYLAVMEKQPMFDTLVFDELDVLFDKYDKLELKKIVSYLKPSNIHMFAGKYEGNPTNFISEYMISYEMVNIISSEKKIDYKDITVNQNTKFDTLLDIMKKDLNSKFLIFVSTKKYAALLNQSLLRKGIKSAFIHGDKGEKSKYFIMEAYNKGKFSVLISTDLGEKLLIDYADYVINYDMPLGDKSSKSRMIKAGSDSRTGYVINFIAERIHRRPVPRTVPQGHVPQNHIRHNNNNNNYRPKLDFNIMQKDPEDKIKYGSRAPYSSQSSNQNHDYNKTTRYVDNRMSQRNNYPSNNQRRDTTNNTDDNRYSSNNNNKQTRFKPKKVVIYRNMN